MPANKSFILLPVFIFIAVTVRAQNPAEKNCLDSIVYLGEIYKTVLITGQCWMKKNLNAGVMVKGNEEQSNNNIIEKYCYNDLPANCNAYGGLYQWDEMMAYANQPGSRGICPSGWHVPSVQEWALLENNLGNYVGTKLKQGDISGFEGFLSGERMKDGTFRYLDYYAYFWTSSSVNADIAWYRVLLHNSIDFDAGSGNHLKSEGFSVRCIHDL